MPYDQITPCTNYKKDSSITAMLPALKEASAKRVEKDRDLQIAREDIAMMKQRIKDNKLSLNKKTREQENSTLEERRKSINKERKGRFAEMAKEDATKYKIYRLTLDDVNARELPLAGPGQGPTNSSCTWRKTPRRNWTTPRNIPPALTRNSAKASTSSRTC